MTLGEIHNENMSTISTNRDLIKSQQIKDQEQSNSNMDNKNAKFMKNIKYIKQNDATISFLRASRSGDLTKVIEFIETGQISNINACNMNGLNALHLAAKDGYSDIVKELLERGIKVDNATKKGNTALHIASLAGQKNVIKLLIQYNANVNVQSSNGFTPLYMAAQENHDSCVRLLLSKGANPSLATEDGFTPLAVAMQQGHDKVVAVLLESDVRGKVRLPALHIAAKKNDVNAAMLLLQNELNPDIVSKSGFTPLHIAAHYGNTEIASLLIERGANVNFTAKHNITPLHVACKWGKSSILKLLLLNKARLDSITRDGLTPLHCASRSGHVEVIELLLINNAPILSKTKNGLSALHMSAQGEHEEAARILLDHNAPVDEVTIDFLTALHVASHCGHIRVAKLLLDYSANPNSRALNGFTPLHIACKKNRVNIVELLLKRGANISATTESGLTPLHVASFMGCMNIVIYLLQYEANPNVPTVRGETPLHLAARANQTDIIRILLRNGTQVDPIAREGQTPLHVSSRLGNIDIITLLLQHGANLNATTKDGYTPLHIASKEGQEEAVQILIDSHGHLDAVTAKGFTALHLASKYGHERVVNLLLQNGANINCLGKNDITPLHIATHYDHHSVVMQLLEKGASPQICAKNGHTALHIAAKKNQMEIAQQLLQNGANPNACSKSGFSPLHLASQEGHVQMVHLLLANGVNVNILAKNGLSPIHLTAQEDKTDVAQILLNDGANISERTKGGYTPLHIAAHYGQINMVKFLLENDVEINVSTNIGYTPLHQAAQQGHTIIINLLLRHKADPNAVTNTGQTALNIAQNLGYIMAVESLKVVTEIKTVNPSIESFEGKFMVSAPELMQDTLLSDSENEGGDEDLDHHQYKYMAIDDLKASNEQYRKNFDTTNTELDQPENGILQNIENVDTLFRTNQCSPSNNNVAIIRQPIHLGFLVSFLVDARGGSMRGCRHSGVCIVVPPKACAQPTRITCRYVKPQRVNNLPPLMEGEALVSRILEMSPIEAKFLSPIVLEVPHFGSLRNKDREIIILRSDNGESWREHIHYGNESDINDKVKEPNNSTLLNSIDELHTCRIIHIVTQHLPYFFAVVSRVRQEVHVIGPDGGAVFSTAVPQVQAIFPPQALTKKIRVGLQAQPVDLKGCCKLFGQGVAVSPVVTIEPRRRKFHKAITLCIPAPKSAAQGMVNMSFKGNISPTIRLLCSITGGQNQAVWEDVTGSTPLAFVDGSVTFTTTVSARFWLMDCRNIADASRIATELYTYMTQVPFMVKFVVYAKRISAVEAKLSVFCMTDDKEDKTLEHQEFFTEVAKSRDVEILQGQEIYFEFSGNFVPVLKSGEHLCMKFHAFRVNRLALIVHIKDQDEPNARIRIMNEPQFDNSATLAQPICSLNMFLNKTKYTSYENSNYPEIELKNVNTQILTNAKNSQKKSNENLSYIDICLSHISHLIRNDWKHLVKELDVPETDIDLISAEHDNNIDQQILKILFKWKDNKNYLTVKHVLVEALQNIGREDIIEKCFFNETEMKNNSTLSKFIELERNSCLENSETKNAITNNFDKIV